MQAAAEPPVAIEIPAVAVEVPPPPAAEWQCILANSNLLANCRNAGRMQQVSRAIKTSVQQSNEGLIGLQLQIGPSSDMVTKFQQCMQWISKYPGLVGSMTWREVDYQFWAGMPAVELSQYMQAAERLSHVGPQMQSLAVINSSQPDLVGAALARLPHLRHLMMKFNADGSVDTIDDNLAQQLSMLTDLTSLSVNNIHNNQLFEHIPAQLKQLYLEYSVDDLWRHATVASIQLQRMTVLETLSICSTRLAERLHQTSLPEQLQCLHLERPRERDWQIERPAVDLDINVSHLTALQMLQVNLQCERIHLQLPTQLQSLLGSFDNPTEPDLGIAQLTQLTHLSLKGVRPMSQDVTRNQQLQILELLVSDEGYPPGVPEVSWASLSCLTTLSLSVRGIDGLEAVKQLASTISTATQISALGLVCKIDWPGQQPGYWDHKEFWSGVANSLTGLRSLEVHDNSEVEGCLGTYRHLSKLTGLTKLVLAGPGCFRLDRAQIEVQQLLRGLTNLEQLEVECEQVTDSTDLLEDVALRLKALRSLSWGGDNIKLNQQQATSGLPDLTSLVRLTCLRGFDAAGADALDRFWFDISPAHTVVK